MRVLERVVLCSAAVCLVTADLAYGCFGREMSDTLPVTGYYAQDGDLLRRGSMRSTMLGMEHCAPYVRKSMGYRASGIGIQYLSAGVSLGLTAAYIHELTNDSRYYVPPGLLTAMDISSAVGGVVTIIGAGMLVKGDYLFYKAVVEHNSDLCRRGLDDRLRDPRINRLAVGKYSQDRVNPPEGVVRHVLKEFPASKPGSVASSVTELASGYAYQWGSYFLGLGLLPLFFGDEIDDQSRKYFWLAGGFTLRGISLTISSRITLRRSIRKYNAEMGPPKPCRPEGGGAEPAEEAGEEDAGETGGGEE
jgi:hypothetical protein